MFWGQGPGLSLYDIGQTGGTEAVTLLQSEMPLHSHSKVAAASPANLNAPGNDRGIARSVGGNAYTANPASLVAKHPQALAPSGGSLPHNNMMPYLTLNFCIALQGVFPPRG